MNAEKKTVLEVSRGRCADSVDPLKTSELSLSLVGESEPETCHDVP